MEKQGVDIRDSIHGIRAEINAFVNDHTRMEQQTARKTTR